MSSTGISDRIRTRLRESPLRDLGLRARVRALEEEVQENRQLNRRIAELTDIVTELLIPLESRDQAQVDEVLARFKRGL